MTVVARKVLARYLQAGRALAPDISKIEALVRRKDFDEALSALDQFLIKELNIRVTKSSDHFNVLTGWVHSLDRGDQARFETFTHILWNLRYALRNNRDEEVMWKSLDRIKDDLPWVEEHSRGQDDEFKHGPFTIILTKGAEGSVDEVLATLDAATAKIRSHSRFQKVLYGRVYVRRGLRNHSPYGGEGGAYVEQSDTISLSLYATPDRDSIKSLVHEFGHRYHTLFLNGDQRERFIELSTVGDIQRSKFSLRERRQLAAEQMALIREHQKETYPDPDTFLSERARLFYEAFPRDDWRALLPLIQRFRDEKDDSVAQELERALAQSQYGGDLEVVLNEGRYHPLHASRYGETKWTENFAECFLAVVLGTSLPEALQDFMEEL